MGMREDLAAEPVDVMLLTDGCDPIRVVQVGEGRTLIKIDADLQVSLSQLESLDVSAEPAELAPTCQQSP